MEPVLLDQAREPEGDWEKVEAGEGWEETDQGRDREVNVFAQPVEQLLFIRLGSPATRLPALSVEPG